MARCGCGVIASGFAATETRPAIRHLAWLTEASRLPGSGCEPSANAQTHLARGNGPNNNICQKEQLPPHMNATGHMRTQREKCIGNFRHFQNLANSSLGATRAGLAAQGLDNWSPNAATGHRTQPGNPPNETCQVNGEMHLLPQRVGRRFRHVPSPSHISTPTKNHSMRRCGKQLLS